MPVTLLPGRGIARRLDARSLLANVGAVAGLVAALRGRLVVVIRRRPVGGGGHGRLRLRADRSGRRGARDTGGARERRRRARGGQSPRGSLRPCRRGGVRGHAPAPCRGHRCARATRHRGERPSRRGGAWPRPGTRSGCRPTDSWWRRWVGRWGRNGSTRRSSGWPSCGRAAATWPSTTWWGGETGRGPRSGDAPGHGGRP